MPQSKGTPSFGHATATPESDAREGVGVLTGAIGKSRIGTDPPASRVSSPHVSLRAAVLRQAIRDAQSANRESSIAVSWIYGQHESAEGFSFVEICDSLAFDPDAARKKIGDKIKIGNNRI